MSVSALEADVKCLMQHVCVCVCVLIGSVNHVHTMTDGSGE
jgi:hypothetical protein